MHRPWLPSYSGTACHAPKKIFFCPSPPTGSCRHVDLGAHRYGAQDDHDVGVATSSAAKADCQRRWNMAMVRTTTPSSSPLAFMTALAIASHIPRPNIAFPTGPTLALSSYAQLERGLRRGMETPSLWNRPSDPVRHVRTSHILDERALVHRRVLCASSRTSQHPTHLG